MWRWAIASLLMVSVLGVAVVLLRHRRHRRLTLATLAAERSTKVAQFPVSISTAACCSDVAAEFAREHIVRIDRFLRPECLQLLRDEAEFHVERMTPSFIPTHKKGRTLSYEMIQRYAPGCLSFYHSPQVQDWVSQIVGLPLVPTPDGDQSSLSILCYREKGDHINWHYDHNFYRGRHFTVLLSLANENRSGGLSQSQLMRKRTGGEEDIIDTSANSLVVFEGARVLHRASPTAEGDLRIMLSMTYTTDPRTNWLKEFARRIKDTAFYGIRALWD